MPKPRALLLLVLADVVLAIMTIVAEFVFNWTLPDALQTYVADSFWPPWSVMDIAAFVIWFVVFLTTIVAWVGLLLYWRPAPLLYVGSWAAMLFLLLISGPSVMSSPGATLQTLETLVGGTIIGLVFFTDLRGRFLAEPA